MSAQPHRRGPSLVAAVLALALAGLQGSAWAEAPLRRYVVVPGDSCWSIAEKFFGDGEKYSVIHEHNALGPMPHVLHPGQQLLLPAEVPGPEAKVGWLHNEVQAKPPWAVDWRSAEADMELWRLHKVATGAGASASIVFEDRSRLRMRPEALLVIYGGGSGKAAQSARPSGTRLVLEKGALRGGLERLDQEADLSVATPAGEVSLRSTDAQVEVDELRSTLVSVFQGAAQVLARGARVLVAQGQGTVVRKGQRPQAPRPLPPQVRWAAGPERQAVAVLPGQLGSFEARWLPEPLAKVYQVELARDPEFRQVLVDAQVGSGVLSFRAQDLAPGDYSVRVSARDLRKLQGPASRTLRLQVVALEASRPPQPAADGAYEVAGPLRLALPGALGAEFELAVDDEPFRAASAPLILLTPGERRLRYRLRDAATATMTTLRLRNLALRGSVAPARLELGAGEGPSSFQIRVEDERGRPVALPGLRFGEYGQDDLALQPQAPGQWEATLPASSSDRAAVAVLALRWPGGELASATVQRAAAAPAAPPAAAPYVWPAEPLSLGWAASLPGLPLRGARPQRLLGLDLGLLQSPTGLAEEGWTLRGALRAEQSWAQGNWGLDALFPFQAGELLPDGVDSNETGDLRLGLRRWLRLAAGLELAARLGLQIPTGGAPRLGGDGSLEPGLLLAWEPWRGGQLGCAQALALGWRSEGTLPLHWAAAYSLLHRPLPQIGLGLELDQLFGLRGAGDLRAWALGAGLQLFLDRSRATLLLRRGLGEDGERALGDLGVELRVDLGW